MDLAKIYQATIVVVFLAALACNSNNEGESAYSDKARADAVQSVPQKDSILVDSAYSVQDYVLVNP